MAAEEFKGETNAERRRFARKPVKLMLSCRCLDKDHVSAPESLLAQDLGAGGLAMSTQRKLDKGQILMLVLYLPPADNIDALEAGGSLSPEACKPVSILSRVAWCAPDPKGGFQVGIQFLDLERDDRRMLKNFLVDYMLDQPDSDLYL